MSFRLNTGWYCQFLEIDHASDVLSLAAQKLFNRPDMMREPSFHRRSHAQGLMHSAKVVIHEVTHYPNSCELPAMSGGLNGSTQHSAQNPHSLKTKAKSAG
jgi:hypothetical protein